jgi:hypothetical protein
MIAPGMFVQALGIASFVIGRGFGIWLASAILIGAGTALVYPTLLAAISDVAHLSWLLVSSIRYFGIRRGFRQTRD